MSVVVIRTVRGAIRRRVCDASESGVATLQAILLVLAVLVLAT